MARYGSEVAKASKFPCFADEGPIIALSKLAALPPNRQTYRTISCEVVSQDCIR